MATKRTKRIDPNAAFNAIMGISPPPEDTPESAAPQPPPPPTEPPQNDAAGAAPEAKKLVQKGYYLTEEQVRQLGILAVMEGVDRSSIVRNALEQYFAAQKGTSL